MRIASIVALFVMLASCAQEPAATDASLSDESEPDTPESVAPDPVAARPMVVVNELDVARDEPPPHGAIGMSTSYPISEAAPGRRMEFKRRVLHVGAEIGEHVIAHDEVYYVTAGEGEVFSDGVTARMTAGMGAYLYIGANVGIRQIGDEPLSIIIAYPKPEFMKEPS